MAVPEAFHRGHLPEHLANPRRSRATAIFTEKLFRNVLARRSIPTPRRKPRNPWAAANQLLIVPDVPGDAGAHATFFSGAA